MVPFSEEGVFCQQHSRCCKWTCIDGDCVKGSGGKVCWKTTALFRARLPLAARSCSCYEQSSQRKNGVQSCLLLISCQYISRDSRKSLQKIVKKHSTLLRKSQKSRQRHGIKSWAQRPLYSL